MPNHCLSRPKLLFFHGIQDYVSFFIVEAGEHERLLESSHDSFLHLVSFRDDSWFEVLLFVVFSIDFGAYSCSGLARLTNPLLGHFLSELLLFLLVHVILVTIHLGLVGNGLCGFGRFRDLLMKPFDTEGNKLRPSRDFE